MNGIFPRSVASLLLLVLGGPPAWGAVENISPRLSVEPGAVNRVRLGDGDSILAVYGWNSGEGSRPRKVLLTHARRDVVLGGSPRPGDLHFVAPARAKSLLAEPGAFWSDFSTKRFHDYAQQSTKILGAAVKVATWVKGGDSLELHGQAFQVLDTPGFTRGAVSYVTSVDGLKVAFTGDLIYGDGKILDLYSFQDAIPEAQILGYHGYGGRLADLIRSLEAIKAARPDLIIPARGPVIRNPAAAIDRLIQRVRALYKNYLSTNALHWYFKEERMRLCGERVMGSGADIQLMPYSLHVDTPEWIFQNSTSRLLISDDGHGFLLDCGYQRVIDAVQDLIAKKVLKKVEGIFVTHFHDDHSDMVQAAAEAFDCPVYATTEYADVLEHPEAYHLPAMTDHAIRDVQAKRDGETMTWREFKITFRFYPGQTYYHGALFVEKPGETPVYFIGDSFAPSGIDDYCVLNRNLVHEDTGYLLCLKRLREVKGDFWLINEHIPHLFRFSDKELDYLETRYRKRIEILSELFPWDDPNYGIDEQWAVFYPYGATVSSGERATLEVRLTNHSPVRRTFQVTPRLPDGFELLKAPRPLTLNPRQAGAVPVLVKGDAPPGHYLVTADVASDGMDFSHWIEALITVK